MHEIEYPEVFISYSWDSEEHKELILELSNRLIEDDGISCDIDQYHTSPPSGWPSWMETGIIKSKYVLVVATERYYKRYMNEEPLGVGKGVKWESLLTKNYLADVDSQNTKFIPIVCEFSDDGKPTLPTFMKSRIWINFSSPEAENENWEQL